MSDNIKDRDNTDAFVEKTVKALYGSLSVIDLVIKDKYYFNTTLEECKTIYSNGTSNYITKDEFGGVMVILL